MKKFLIFLLLLPLLSAILLCDVCKITTVLMEVESSPWPGMANITAKLYYFELPEGKDPAALKEALSAGKIGLEDVKKVTFVSPIVGENISIYYNWTNWTDPNDPKTKVNKEDHICTKETDEKGEVRCEISVGEQGCGTIIVRFTPREESKLSPAEAGRPFCVRRVPFATAIDTVGCLAIFALIATLAAGLYATGKSPLAAFDITTPKTTGGFGTYPGRLHIKARFKPISGLIPKAQKVAGRMAGVPVIGKLAKRMDWIAGLGGRLEKYEEEKLGKYERFLKTPLRERLGFKLSEKRAFNKMGKLLSKAGGLIDADRNKLKEMELERKKLLSKGRGLTDADRNKLKEMELEKIEKLSEVASRPGVINRVRLVIEKVEGLRKIPAPTQKEKEEFKQARETKEAFLSFAKLMKAKIIENLGVEGVTTGVNYDVFRKIKEEIGKVQLVSLIDKNVSKKLPEMAREKALDRIAAELKEFGKKEEEISKVVASSSRFADILSQIAVAQWRLEVSRYEVMKYAKEMVEGNQKLLSQNDKDAFNSAMDLSSAMSSKERTEILTGIVRNIDPNSAEYVLQSLKKIRGVEEEINKSMEEVERGFRMIEIAEKRKEAYEKSKLVPLTAPGWVRKGKMVIEAVPRWEEAVKEDYKHSKELGDKAIVDGMARGYEAAVVGIATVEKMHFENEIPIRFEKEAKREDLETFSKIKEIDESSKKIVNDVKREYEKLHLVSEGEVADVRREREGERGIPPSVVRSGAFDLLLKERARLEVEDLDMELCTKVSEETKNIERIISEMKLSELSVRRVIEENEKRKK